MIITACLSSFSTGGPNKEHGTNKIQGRIIWEGPKGGRRHKPMICFANLPETFTLDSMLSGRCAFNMKGPWIRSNMGPRKMIGHRQPEKSSHYHYGELQGRAVLLGCNEWHGCCWCFGCSSCPVCCYLALRGESPCFSRVVAGKEGLLSSCTGDLREPLVLLPGSQAAIRDARGLSVFLSYAEA